MSQYPHLPTHTALSLKGTKRPAAFRGENHRNARLSEGQVRLIRSQYAAKSTTNRVSMGKLARAYGVGKTQIARILKYERWAHVI